MSRQRSRTHSKRKQKAQVLNYGEVLGTVQGEDFYRALLKVWLGDKPADKGLKKAWLGK
jgi:hypothetical protein